MAKRNYQNLPGFKELKEFQIQLKQRKRCRTDIPFSKRCLVSVNGKEAVETDVCAQNGILTICGNATFVLRNHVKSLKNEEDTSKSVVIESTTNMFFDKIEITFKDTEDKLMFLIFLGDLCNMSLPPSPTSDGSDDSGL